MAFTSFESFGALRNAQSRAAASLGGREVLRVTAELPADNPGAAAGACRAAILDWARTQNGEPLPTEAAAYRDFEYSNGLRRCDGIRVRAADLDIWSVRLRRPGAGNSGRLWITEVGCEARRGAAPVVRIRMIVDGDEVPPDCEPRVPAVLPDLAELVALRQSGEPITTDPWLVDSQSAAERFIEVLADRARRRPMMVLSVPDEAPRPTRPYLDPGPLARAAAGLATVVVLPANYTWNLTRRFGKHLSVYLGAARLYLPGFTAECDGREHRLIMGEWFQSPEGLARNRAEMLRRAAEYSLRSQPAWSFDKVREQARRLARERAATAPAEAPAAVPASAPTAAPVEPSAAEEAAEAPLSEPAPAAAVTGPSTRDEETAAVPPSPTADEPRRAAAVPDAAPVAETPGPAPEEVVGKPAATGPGPIVWLWNRASLLARFFSRALDPLAEDPVRVRLRRESAALALRLEQLDASRERDAAELRKSEEEKDFYLSEYEGAFARAQDAERERDAVRKEGQRRVQSLTDQLRRHGHHAHPEGWKDMVRWCAAEFGDRLELRPGAVQGIKKADFEDLWLAAECLIWLAGPYRDSRRVAGGRQPNVKTDVDSRLSDGPAGKGVHFEDWNRVPVHERRNIKRGNDRERKHCLRIYYYWDAAGAKVVIVSMPHHAQTRAS